MAPSQLETLPTELGIRLRSFSSTSCAQLLNPALSRKKSFDAEALLADNNQSPLFMCDLAALQRYLTDFDFPNPFASRRYYGEVGLPEPAISDLQAPHSPF